MLGWLPISIPQYWGVLPLNHPTGGSTVVDQIENGSGDKALTKRKY